MSATPNGNVVANGQATDDGLNRSNSAENPPDASTAAGNPMREPSRDLTQMDVAALIINKMIGTGIFSSPFTVLINSPNKRTAIGLWICGYAYTIFSMIMYLEFARKLPFTGGELVYLDDILPQYPLFTSTIYAFYFVFVYTTSTNAMYFAAQVLLASAGETRLRDFNADQRILRFLAVATTTAICLLLYVSSTKSRLLNRLTALAKILLLLIICGFGFAYISKMEGEDTPYHYDWALGPPENSEGVPEVTLPGEEEPMNPKWQSAFLTILFTFHGWENATLVSGEIPSFSVLRKGTIWALGIVGGLYFFIVTIVGLTFTWQEGTPREQSYNLENYVAVFLNVANSHDKGRFENASIAAAILISISAIGSMISVTYTCVRVKQSIGWTNILPWSWLLRRSGPLRPGYQRIRQGQGNDELTVRLALRNENPYSYLGTPEGGIVAHWIMTVFYICVTAAISPLERAIGFSANLLVYGHFFIEALVGVGFTWFKSVDPRPRPRGYPATGWFPRDIPPIPPKWMRTSSSSSSIEWVRKGIFQIALGLGIMIISLVLIVLDAYTGRKSTYWDFMNLSVTAGLLVVACFYWFFFARARPRSEIIHATTPSERLYESFGCDLELFTHGSDDFEDPERICSFCARFQGMELQFLDQYHPRSHSSESQLDLAAHRHPHYGYLRFISSKRRRQL